MIFKRIFTIAVIVLLGLRPAGAAERSQTQEDCAIYARSRAHVGWEDVCYSKDDYPAQKAATASYAPDRGAAVDNALDSFEKAGNRAQHRTDQLLDMAYPGDEPRDYYVTYEDARDEEEEAEKVRKAENTEQWLQREYPYFYKDHMEKKASDGDYRSLYQEGQEMFDDGSHSWVPPFLKYLDFGFVVETNQKPTYYLDGVFPIIQTEDLRHTIFSQDRAQGSPGREGSYSFGAGYRYFDQNVPAIAGVNIFYDMTKKMDHYRWGTGLELFTSYVEGRANFYMALSEARKVNRLRLNDEQTLILQDKEQAIDGYDLELGIGNPEFNFVKAFGGYESYNHMHGPDESNWTARMELKPAPFTTVNLTYAGDSGYQDPRYGIDGRFHFNFSSFDPKDMLQDLLVSQNSRYKVDFTERLFDRVERNFDIKTETWTEEKPLPFTVGNLAIIRLIVRFPGAVCSDCLDNNGDGIVQADDGFEVDFELTNLTNDVSTGIEYFDAELSTGWDFVHNNFSPLPDAPPGGTVRTDEQTDMDINIPNGTADGTTFTLTLHFKADGEESLLTFGPFVVGDIRHGDIIEVTDAIEL